LHKVHQHTDISQHSAIMKSNQVDLTLFVHTLPRTSIDQNGAYKYPPDQKNNYDSKHVLSTRCCHIIWKYLQSCAKVDI